MRKVIPLFVILSFIAVPVFAGENDRHFMHSVVTYLPNRLLDVVDIARLRVRVGPGFAAGVRVTEAADVFAGSYFSVYAGLPGPRPGRLPVLPIGLETRTGVEASIVDVSTGMGLAPEYSFDEVGLGFHAGIVGVDLGVAPLEIFDLLVGIIGFDPGDDDF